MLQSRSCKEPDMTEQLNSNNSSNRSIFFNMAEILIIYFRVKTLSCKIIYDLIFVKKNMKTQIMQSRMVNIFIFFFMLFRIFIKSFNKHVLLIKMFKLFIWVWESSTFIVFTYHKYEICRTVISIHGTAFTKHLLCTRH